MIIRIPDSTVELLAEEYAFLSSPSPDHVGAMVDSVIRQWIANVRDTRVRLEAIRKEAV